MPSKGTPRYTFRLPRDLMDQVELTVLRRNNHTFGEPWLLSDFVRIALREKVEKMERSRGGRTKATIEGKISGDSAIAIENENAKS